MSAATTDSRVDEQRATTKEVLREIWRGLLHVQDIGCNDDFVLLGGHSITAVQIISRVEEQFGVEIALREVFQFPTIEKFSRLIEEYRQKMFCTDPAGEKHLADDLRVLVSTMPDGDVARMLESLKDFK